MFTCESSWVFLISNIFTFYEPQTSGMNFRLDPILVFSAFYHFDVYFVIIRVTLKGMIIKPRPCLYVSCV